MMPDRTVRHIIISTLAALAGHLILFNFLFSIFPAFYDTNPLRLADQRHTKQIVLTKVDQKTLQKYKTVGVKNGKKDFSAPIKLPKSNGKKGVKKSPKRLSLRDLGFNMKASKSAKNTKVAPKPTMKGGIKVYDPKVKKAIEKTKKERMLNNMIKREMIRNADIARRDVPLLKSADINMHFTPPEGVDESELNSVEKKFFSFRKRSYERYVNSFLKSFNEEASKRPYIRDLFSKGSDVLTGKITFDSQGNIVSIKILKWAHNDDIQRVFEETLEGIQALKNPPVEFVRDNGEFTVYYKLNINN